MRICALFIALLALGMPAPVRACPPSPACGIGNCQWGYAHDENGCSLCACNPPSFKLEAPPRSVRAAASIQIWRAKAPASRFDFGFRIRAGDVPVSDLKIVGPGRTMKWPTIAPGQTRVLRFRGARDSEQQVLAFVLSFSELGKRIERRHVPPTLEECSKLTNCDRSEKALRELQESTAIPADGCVCSVVP